VTSWRNGSAASPPPSSPRCPSWPPPPTRSPRPGFPDTTGQASWPRWPLRHPGGRNQYPPARHPRAAPSRGQPPKGLVRTGLRPRRRGAGHVGATEAIAATLLALCEPGDEVVMFEPSYDSYAACCLHGGAVPRRVRLHTPDWHFDPDELAAAIGPRPPCSCSTPPQPDRQGLRRRRAGQIAALCLEHDLIAVTDEVYDTWSSRAPPAAGRLSRHAGRAPWPSRRGQDLLLHRVEGGWVTASAPLWRHPIGQTVLDYTSGRPSSWPSPRPGQPEPSTPWARVGGQARSLLRRIGRAGLRRPAPAATYFATTTSPPWPGHERIGVLPHLPGRCGVVAIPSSVFYDPTDAQAGRTWCAGPLQADRRAEEALAA